MQTVVDILESLSEVSVAKKPLREKPLFLRLPPAYHDALAALAKKARRTLTAEAMIAFEEYFAKNNVKIPTTEDTGS